MFRWGKTKKRRPEIHPEDEQSHVTLLGQQQRAEEALRAASFSVLPQEDSQTEVSSTNVSEKQSEAQAVSPTAPVSLTEQQKAEEEQASSPPTLQGSPTSLSASPPVKAPATPPVPVVATSWSDALYLACKANQTFSRTPKQVLQEQQQVSLPRVDSVVLYQNNVEDTAKAVVEEMNKTAVPLSSDASTTSSSLARQVFNSVKWGASSAMWVGSKVIQSVVGDEDDYDENELTYSEQADDVNESVQTTVGLNVPVVCVDLVAECVDQLLFHGCADKMLALSRQGTGKYSFAGWAASTSSLCLNMKAPDVDLLAHVMVSANHAVFYENYIVLGKSAMTETELQVAASLAQLKQAIQDTQDRMEEWTRLEKDCTSLATLKNKRGDKEGAKHELKKRRLLRQKIESACVSLFNLHQTHDTLETSQLQHTHVLKPLEAAASALKALREECPVEKVDDVMLDLQEESDHLNAVSNSIQPVGGQDYDEEDLLLQELARLTLEDDKVEEKSEVEKIGLESPPRIDEAEKENDVNSHEPDLPPVGTKHVSEEDVGAKDKKESAAVETPAV